MESKFWKSKMTLVYNSSGRTVGHRWNNPQMLVDITSITTITNKLTVNILQIFTVSRKNVNKHSLFRPLHFVNSCSPKCRNCHFRGLRNAHFDGEEPPDHLKRVSLQLLCPPLDEKSFLRHCPRTLNFPYKSLAGTLHHACMQNSYQHWHCMYCMHETTYCIH